MIQKDRKVTIRLTEEELDTVEILAQKTESGNVSDFIRTAIQLMVERATAPPNQRVIVATVPAAMHDKLQRLVAAGEALSVEAELVDAVKSHLMEKTEHLRYLERRMSWVEEQAVKRNIRQAAEGQKAPGTSDGPTGP